MVEKKSVASSNMGGALALTAAVSSEDCRGGLGVCTEPTTSSYSSHFSESEVFSTFYKLSDHLNVLGAPRLTFRSLVGCSAVPASPLRELRH